MAVEGEGTGEGTETGAGTGQQGGEFRAQFPADLKDHEAFKPYKTIGDLGKAHIDLMGKAKELDGMSAKVKDLETKLSNTIPKLPENATPEEIEVFYESLGKPESPKGYAIPKPEGSESDPKMVEWAQNTFYGANLSKHQAEFIGKEFNTFMDNVVKADLERRASMLAQTEGSLKQEWGDKFDGNVELVRRVWEKFTNSEIKAFLEEDHKGPIGNHPSFIKFLHGIGKVVMDDTTPKGSQAGGATGKVTMVYPDMKGKA